MTQQTAFVGKSEKHPGCYTFLPNAARKGSWFQDPEV